MRPLAATASLVAVAAAAAVMTGMVQAAADVRLTAPAATAYVTDRSGTFITQAGHETRQPGGGRQIEYGYWPVDPPEMVVRATLALEDRRFWSHPGVDPVAVVRAVWEHLRSGHGSGGSTIAMQVVRMQHPRPRVLWSKMIEAFAAVGLTLRYGHAAVLAQYLKLAPYGEGSHGIAHAARWYFDRPAADLSPAQAALLCAIPQAPGLLSLRDNVRPARLARTRARAARALASMGLPSEVEAESVYVLGAIRPQPAPRRPTDLLLAQRLQDLADGRMGPLLRASIDLTTQSWVRERAAAHLLRWRRDGAQQAAVMVVRRQDRSVMASLGSVDTGVGSGIDFTRALRSPGSTLKPFLYAQAFDQGLITPEDMMADLPERSAGINNADHDFLGRLLPRQALGNSRNVPATNLLRRIGLGRAFAALRSLGLHQVDGPAERFGLAMAIGALPSSLERLMRAYATLADDGLDHDLDWFTPTQESSHRLLSLDAARLVGRFLSDPVARLPSFPRYGSSEFPFAVALKTGTSQGYRDAWTLAWSRDFVVGVWIGRADAGPMSRLSGSRAAAGLAQELMLGLHRSGRTDLLAGEFAAPPGRTQTELCVASEGPACNQRIAEWVRPRGPAPTAPAPARLAIVRPDDNLHVWRNPNLPAAMNRLVLRATTDPAVPQVVWVVDGQPVSVAAPDAPLVWTLTPGRHRFQVRLPMVETASAPVTVVVD